MSDRMLLGADASKVVQPVNCRTCVTMCLDMSHNEIHIERAVTQDQEDSPDRKERVLHTRVPAVLEDELKNLANALRVPVSNVVRTILEDAIATAEVMGRRAEGELRTVADRIARRRKHRGKSSDDAADAPETKPPQAPLAGVVGYQPLMLAQATDCAVCGKTLEQGAKAFLGVRSVAGETSPIVGSECLPVFVNPTKQEETP